METYKASHVRLLQELKAKGWTVKEGLKIPYAVHSAGYRLYFKKEAIYFATKIDYNFNSARSLWIDSRGMTVETLAETAERWSL